MRLPGELLRDRQGGVAVMAACGGTLLCGMAALVVDIGSVALYARHLQGAADLSALAAARDLDRGEAAARATTRDNLGAEIQVAVQTGAYAADASVRPPDRFSPGGETPNAARVTLTGEAPLHFGRWLLGRETLTVTRRATAAVEAGPPRAMFSIGSRLARLDGGLANQLLTGLTGSSVSLTVADYRNLADARVNLLDFSDAMATDLGLTAGDYDRLLATEVEAGRTLGVLDRLLGDDDGGGLDKLARAADGMRIRMGELIGVEADAPQGLAGGLDAEVAALDLATALLETGGDRQLALNAGAQAGLAALEVKLAVGERPNRSPWLTVTDHGAPIIRTAQARLYLKARTSQKLAGLAQVQLPILIELAAAEARLERLSCSPARTVDIGVRPGVARAMIGAIDESRLDDFKQTLTPGRATLMSVAGLVTITGKADIEAADQGFVTTRFSDADIRDQTVRTVGSRGFAGGLVVSLIQRLNVEVKVVGLGLGLGGLAQSLGVLLTPLGPVLDGVVNPILDTLGLKFGEADVTVHGLDCPDDGRPAQPVLVG